jgi:hypothetical protein
MTTQIPITPQEKIQFNQNINLFYKRVYRAKENKVYDLSPFEAMSELQEGDVILQSTGAKDKNGKLIFISDILIVNGVKCVAWACDMHRFAATVLNSRTIHWLSATNGKIEKDTVEVIGNIYENEDFMTPPPTTTKEFKVISSEMLDKALYLRLEHTARNYHLFEVLNKVLYLRGAVHIGSLRYIKLDEENSQQKLKEVIAFLEAYDIDFINFGL